MITVKASPEAHKVIAEVKDIKRKHKKALRSAMHDIGRKSQKDVRKNIALGRKSGRLYKVGGRVHRSSAPGEAPAFLSGDLSRSVKYDVTGHKKTTFGYMEEYGFYLEKGTEKDGSDHILPRPNLQKVMDDNTQTFINYMVRAYRADK